LDNQRKVKGGNNMQKIIFNWLSEIALSNNLLWILINFLLKIVLSYALSSIFLFSECITKILVAPGKPMTWDYGRFFVSPYPAMAFKGRPAAASSFSLIWAWANLFMSLLWSCIFHTKYVFLLFFFVFWSISKKIKSR